MKLSHFSFLLSLGLFSLSMCLAVLAYFKFYLPGIELEILDQQRKEVSSLQTGIAFSQRNLQTFSFDYAVWDDMVDYIVSPSQEFIDSGLPASAFKHANVDAVYILDREGNRVWTHEAVEAISLPAALATWRGKVLPDDAAIAAEIPSVRSGLLNLHGTLVFFSNVTVLPSKEQGEVVGSVLMLRAIDPGVIEELTALTLVKFELLPYKPSEAVVDIPLFGQEISEVADRHQWLLQDAFGQANIVLSIWHAKTRLPSLFSQASVIFFFLLLLLSFGGVLPLSIYVLGPIIRANRLLTKMASAGEPMAMPTGLFISELNSFSLAFNDLMDRLQSHQHYLESLSMQDPLTGIANRRGLESFATRAHRDWRSGKGTLGFLMIDIDAFKAYNDTQGHSAGDQAILQVAQVLLLECRRRGELATRYGGEEFCIVVHGDNIEQMAALAERMLQRVRQLKIPHPGSSHGGILTISIGGVLYEPYHLAPDDASWAEMLNLADKQLYVAKAAGRNQISLQYSKIRQFKMVT